MKASKDRTYHIWLDDDRCLYTERPASDPGDPYEWDHWLELKAARPDALITNDNGVVWDGTAA